MVAGTAFLAARRRQHGALPKDGDDGQLARNARAAGFDESLAVVRGQEKLLDR